jgi:hypothetical protein
MKANTDARSGVKVDLDLNGLDWPACKRLSYRCAPGNCPHFHDSPAVSGKNFASEWRRNAAPACTLPMKNTYYHVGSPDEIATILRDGFVDNMKTAKQRGRRNWRGVCIADSPTEPDPDYPHNQLLEITFHTQVNTSKWRLVIPEVRAFWNPFIIPARVLNKHARVRLPSSEEWEQAWDKYKVAQADKMREELTAAGFIERAKDSQGQLMYRDGKPLWQWSQKTRSINPEDKVKAVFKAALMFPPFPPSDRWS